MTSLSNTIKVTAETVCSQEYHQRAAYAMYMAFVEKGFCSPSQLQDMLEWRDAGGYFPIIMGSGMAVDVPIALNVFVHNGWNDQQLLEFTRKLVHPNRSVGSADDRDDPEVEAWYQAWNTVQDISRRAGYANAQ